MELVITITTVAVLSLMLIGFLIGFLRNWKKSLIRLGILIACLVAAIFLSPVIAGAIMGKVVKGLVLTIFGFSVNFEEIAKGMVDESFANDLMSTNGTTTELANALMHVTLNVLCFISIFIVLCVISWIIYAIVFAVIGKKNKGQEKIRDGRYWGLKTVGGFVGLVGGVVVCFAFLTPVFGAMNICNKFVSEANANTASAAAPTSYLCGELYYKEDEKIGKVEGYIERYASFKKMYDKSFVGTLFNITGVSKVGTSTFNYLTNVKSDGLKVNFTNEFVSMINVYNSYKETFVAKKFDLADNECVDNLKNLYNLACKSEVVKSYIIELVPKLSEKWINGEKFLGISLPVTGDYEKLAKDALVVFNTNSITRINDNVMMLLDAIKVSNSNGFTKSIRENQELTEYLNNNDTFVKEEILTLAKTSEMRNALPSMINDFMEIAHKQIIGGEADYSSYKLTQEEIDALVWESEATSLQNLTNSLIEVYMDTKDTTEANVLIDNLKRIGYVIDESRNSKMISKPLKPFMISYINSDKFNLSENSKTTITDTIDKEWDNTDFKFEDMFGAIEEAAKVAQKIIDGAGDVSLDDLSKVLEDVLTSDNPAADSVRNTVKEILNSDTISQIVGENKEAQVLTDMLDTLIDCKDKDEIRAGIKAGQEIVNIVNNNKNSDGLVLEGTTTEEKQENAKQVIENIAGSNLVMDLLEDAASDDESAIKQITSTIGGDSEILKDAIGSANISEENKAILNRLFGNI